MDLTQARLKYLKKKEESSSEQLWIQVGTNVNGKEQDRIGEWYVGLNSSDGTRVYFSVGDGYYGNIPELRIYQLNGGSEWTEQQTDEPISLSVTWFDTSNRNVKDLITISADGNRFAVSSYNYNNQGTVGI